MRLSRFLLLFLALAILPACSDSKPAATASAGLPALNLGRPGTSQASGAIAKKESTHVLEADESINFIGDQGLAEIRHHAGRRFAPGDVLLGNETQKLLLTVREVREQGETSSRLLTQLGVLPDLLGEGKTTELKIEATPKLGEEDQKTEGAAFRIDKDGRATLRNAELFRLDLNSQGNLQGQFNRVLGLPTTGPLAGLSVSGTAGGQFRAVVNEAAIQVIPTFRNEYRWEGRRPEELRSQVDALLKYSLDITWEFSGNAQIQLELEPFRKKSIPIRIPGAVPVYMDIELGLPMGIILAAEKKGKVRVRYEAEYGFHGDLHYTAAGGLRSSHEQGARVIRQEIISGPAEGKVSAELYVQPTIETKVYRVVGPNVYLQPYVRAEWQNPRPPRADDLFVGVGGGFGLQVTEPLFLNTILKLDTGRIFDWSQSWDLDGSGVASAPEGTFRPREETNVGALTDEGFVVLSLRDPAMPAGTRFRLVKDPAQGLAVASPHFFLDGQLYYYPRGGEQNDSLTVAIVSPEGKLSVHEVRLKREEEVLKRAAAPRFSQGGNSVTAAYAGPAEVSEKVPHYNVGEGFSFAAAAVPPSTDPTDAAGSGVGPFPGHPTLAGLGNPTEENLREAEAAFDANRGRGFALYSGGFAFDGFGGGRYRGGPANGKVIRCRAEVVSMPGSEKLMLRLGGCEGLFATVSALTPVVRVTGAPSREVPVTRTDGIFTFALSPEEAANPELRLTLNLKSDREAVGDSFVLARETPLPLPYRPQAGIFAIPARTSTTDE